MPDTVAPSAHPTPEPIPDQHRLAERASHVLEDAKQIGGELLTAARESVAGLADEQRKRAADQIAAVGDALRCSVEPLDRGNGIGLGRYAEDAARRVDEFAQTVRTRSWEQLAGDAERLAREWPLVFFAAAIGLGFVGGRLLLSGAPHPAPARPQPVATPVGHFQPKRDFGSLAGNSEPATGIAREQK